MHTDNGAMSSTDLSRKRTFLVLGSICLAYVVWGVTWSLQPTFYPEEAASKGASPSQYGFVFGIANIAGFTFAPIFAHFGKRIVPKYLYNAGGLLMGLSTVSFGCLEYAGDKSLFLGLSYFLRSLDGIAIAASSTAVLSILMIMYPTKVATVSGTTEMFFGVGYMLGPIVGAALNSAENFGFPFYVVGSISLSVTLAQIVLLPNKAEKEGGARTGDEKSKSLTLLTVIKTPAFMLVALDNLLCFSGVGMVESMLEPYVTSTTTDATQLEVAAAYLIFGLCYMTSTPLLGFLADRTSRPSSIALAGNVLLATSFLLIGPAPFLPFSPDLPLTYGMMATFGTGTGMISVSTVSRAHRLAVDRGCEDDVGTFMVIAALWSSTFQLGGFVGSSAGGVLVDAFGFRNTTVVLFAIYVLMIVIDLLDTVRQVRSGRQRTDRVANGRWATTARGRTLAFVAK